MGEMRGFLSCVCDRRDDADVVLDFGRLSMCLQSAADGIPTFA